jgi:hypothetical protein
MVPEYQISVPLTTGIGAPFYSFETESQVMAALLPGVCHICRTANPDLDF